MVNGQNNKILHISHFCFAHDGIRNITIMPSVRTSSYWLTVFAPSPLGNQINSLFRVFFMKIVNCLEVSDTVLDMVLAIVSKHSVHNKVRQSQMILDGVRFPASGF